MKRDHMMGYTGHLDALFGKQEQLSVRTPPRPPQSQAQIEILRMQDKVETQRLTQAHALANSIELNRQEQSRLHREGKNSGGISEYVAHMNTGRDLLPYQKSILDAIRNNLGSDGKVKVSFNMPRRTGKLTLQKALSATYGGCPATLHNTPKDPTAWPFPESNVLSDCVNVAAKYSLNADRLQQIDDAKMTVNEFIGYVEKAVAEFGMLAAEHRLKPYGAGMLKRFGAPESVIVNVWIRHKLSPALVPDFYAACAYGNSAARTDPSSKIVTVEMRLKDIYPSTVPSWYASQHAAMKQACFELHKLIRAQSPGVDLQMCHIFFGADKPSQTSIGTLERFYRAAIKWLSERGEWPVPEEVSSVVLNTCTKIDVVAQAKLDKVLEQKAKAKKKPTPDEEKRQRLVKVCTDLMEQLKASYVKENAHPKFLRELDAILDDYIEIPVSRKQAHPLAEFKNAMDSAPLSELRELINALTDWHEDHFDSRDEGDDEGDDEGTL